MPNKDISQKQLSKLDKMKLELEKSKLRNVHVQGYSWDSIKDKQVTQIVNIFKANNAVTDKYYLSFMWDIFRKFPDELLSEVATLMWDSEILKLKYKK